MIETMSLYQMKNYMETNDFYRIETPPSSTNGKSSTGSSPISWQTTHKSLFAEKQNTRQEHIITCDYDQFGSSVYDDMHTPLRRTLGNTKLKTRQDVRRFRKFLKRNYNLQSMALIDIDPDTLRNYLMDYLTSIRTRKGLKYDPETLRSYYLSIQRFLKDSHYPYCLRNSPHFASCRDLIIQMRKEKNQHKNSPSPPVVPSINGKNKKERTIGKQLVQEQSSSDASHVSETSGDDIIEIKPDEILQFDRSSPSALPTSSEMNNPDFSSKFLLPTSSLPPRKRQQMKYFLECNSSPEQVIPSSVPYSPHYLPSTTSCPLPSTHVLSSEAYSLLLQMVHLSSSHSRSMDVQLKTLLDQSSNCGYSQRILLANLCEEWQGDIRLLHSNLRSELNSLLPHILLSNILSRRY